MTEFDKKTERLDIRLSHNKKQDFVQACENQGDTPSSAVRRFITTYIRRERRDDTASKIRFSNWKQKLALGAAGCAAIFLMWGFAASQTHKTLTAKTFKLYDANQNGVIELGEIASNDMHLHRVLNIDGVEGISPEEFQLKGKMVWNFMPENGFQILEDKQGLFKQTSVTSFTTPRLDMEELTSQQKALRQKFSHKIVGFDLRNPQKRQINVFEEQASDITVSTIDHYQRSVTWIEGRPTPEHVMGSGRDKAVLTNAAPPTRG